jgi:valyl-tRNA synthetase
METGYDILFFWVARMIMMGLEFTGEEPFHTVYLHGLIRDEHGKKMSKSYGNVIDPLTVMDELGTDALRFTLLVGSTPGNDMNLSTKKVEANRNFANKVWNAGRFVISAIQAIGDQGKGDRRQGANPYSLIPYPLEDATLADAWIWTRLQSLVRDVERLFQGYQYGEAGRQIYDFFLSELADWYVEIAKLQIAEGDERALSTVTNLTRVFDACLRLLHPFTPFVTEELWGHLKQAARALEDRLGQPGMLAYTGTWEDALIVAGWPAARPEEAGGAETVSRFNLVQDIVRAIRNVRAEKDVKPGRRIPAVLVSQDYAPVLRDQARSLSALAGIDAAGLTIAETLPSRPEGHIALVLGPVEVYLPLAGMVDVGEERQRLEKELAENEAQVRRLKALLSSPFAEKAPAAVVQKERDKLAVLLDAVDKIQAQLKALE